MKKISLLILLLTTACATSGVKVEQNRLESFHKGKTTYSEVVEAIGKPTQTIVSDTGAKAAVYTYMSAQARPESFIPYVGLFVGGVDTENSTVIFNFDKADVMTGYTSTSGAAATGMGFEAMSQPRNTDQPRVAK